MSHHGISSDTAFELLRRWSQETNTKLGTPPSASSSPSPPVAASGERPNQVIEQDLPWRQLSPR